MKAARKKEMKTERRQAKRAARQRTNEVKAERRQAKKAERRQTNEVKAERRQVKRMEREKRREARRELVRKRNEPPLLTKEEERFNAVSHGAGAILAAVCTALLLRKSESAFAVAASLVYGISMILMMLMSCVYHAMPAGSGAKRVCRRFDYTSIFLLIGGTFAPLLLIYLGGKLGMILFCIQWGVILLGSVWILTFGPGKWRWLPFTLYFLIGWSGVAFIPEFWMHARTLLWFILMGGLVYTAGMIPFARKQKYAHCVWHMFVLTGAVLHWIGIYTQIY